MDCFQTLKKRINEVITDLLNQVHLARVFISICRDLSRLTDVVARIKQNGLKAADSWIDTAILRSDLKTIKLPFTILKNVVHMYISDIFSF